MALKDDLKMFNQRLQTLQAGIETRIKASVIRAEGAALNSIADALKGVSDDFKKIEVDLEQCLQSADVEERRIHGDTIETLRLAIEKAKVDFVTFILLAAKLPVVIKVVYAAMSPAEARPALENVVQRCPELMTYAMRLHERTHARLEQHFQATAAAGLFGSNSGANGNDEAKDERRPDGAPYSAAP